MAFSQPGGRIFADKHFVIVELGPANRYLFWL